MAEESNALVPIEQKVVEFYGDELTAVLIESELSGQRLLIGGLGEGLEVPIKIRARSPTGAVT